MHPRSGALESRGPAPAVPRRPRFAWRMRAANWRIGTLI